MKRTFNLILIASCLLFAAACKKNSTGDLPIITQPGDIKAAPDGFNFVTSRQVDLSVRLLTNNNKAIGGVPVNILLPGTTAEKDGVIFKAVSDANGYIKGSVSVPSYIDTLVIQPNYPGLINNAKALISSDVLIATIGGTEGYGGAVVPEPFKTGSSTGDPRVLTVDPNTGIDIVYPSPYTNTSSATKSNGLPKYLESDRDDIDEYSLAYMAYAFPEGATNNVSSVHPEYFTSPVSSVNITKSTSLYVTFISEGASYTNSLAYYTYPTNNPPTSPTDVDKVTLVFPNASANGSGGSFRAGDKVKIGPFTAGTTVGFVILQNAWTGSGITVSTQKFFSTPALNPESTTALKRHNFMLSVPDLSIYLFGFEDLNRQSASTNPGNNATDNDFNDVLFYVTPSASNAVDNTGVWVLGAVPDADGDGVNDTEDEFPNDATRAYTEVTAWRTLAFEDLWPTTGDYDMNDVVIQYRYNYVKNASNNYVEFTADYKVLAAGAVYNDGFGVEFPFAPSLVKSVSGYRLIHNYVTLSSNGTEAGQSKAVIIPFDDYHAVINNTGVANPAINTNMSLPKVEGDLLNVKVVFNSPITAATLNASAFNPFLIGSVQRGIEIHLSGKTPTDKADRALLGTKDDKSNATTGKYYQTVNNWPWAIDIAGTFQHPVESAPISSAYLRFLTWAQSGGSQYADWFSGLTSGYRNTSLIYTK